MQKAKIRWAIEGDENSKYFHAIINKKRANLSVKGIMVDGDWIVEPDLVKQEFRRHFTDRFQDPGSRRGSLNFPFPNRLNNDQILELESPISNEDIRTAVWGCGVDKSPRPDGFTFEFFRKYWTVVGPDFCIAVKWFFDHGDFAIGCNSSFVALIPKVLDPKVVSDYCPISLIGSLYKVVTKILASRLSLVISDLISDVQTAFLPNRQILDGPFIINEILARCKLKKQQAMIFKVDFAKAYDSVRWDYLDDVLISFGFGPKWRSWIRGSLSSGKASILVNGSPTTEFHLYRGLKQGDPLAPFLFLLIMESLHLSFSRAVEAGIFKGYKIDPSTTLSHLFYADDAVFIGEWSHSNLKGIMNILRCFSLLSGMSINIQKSHLLGVGIPDNCVAEAAKSIGCLIMKAPFKYLGILVGDNMSSKKAWDETINKMKKRLSRWKLNTLSVGGRLTLLKSVLGSTPIYNMSIFKVPKSVLNYMESLRRNFFNGFQEGDRKIAWVKWSKVLASKKFGGLGVSSFFALNRALLFKWVWRYLSHDNSLWSRIISALHGLNGHVLSAAFNSTWSSIITEVNSLKVKGVDLISHCKIRVGKGTGTSFWKDLWIGDNLLKLSFPRLFALEENKDISVADKMNTSISSSFRRHVRGGVESQQLDQLSLLLDTVILSNMDDRWFWDLNGDGVFQVKDVRSMLDEAFLPKMEVPTRWIKSIPIKVNVFAWKLYLDRLPTRSNLSRRNVSLPSLACPLCDHVLEDSSHLFFGCSVAKDIQKLICRWWNLDVHPYESYEDWLSWFKSIRLGSKTKEVLEGVFYVSWWSLWNFRNQFLFASPIPRKDAIFDNIVLRSFYWCVARCNRTLNWLLKTIPLRYGLHTRILPVISLVRTFVTNDEQGFKVIRKGKWLFGANLDNVSANLSQLQIRGLSGDPIVRLITNYPWVVTIDSLAFERRLARVVEELGIPEHSKMFVYGICVVTKLKKSTIEKKLKILRDYGWSEEEIATFVRSNPMRLGYSEAKIRQWLDFFMKELGYTTTDLSSYTGLLSCSLEKRVKPRYKVFTILKEKKLSSKPSFARLVNYSEVKFLKFLNDFENELPGLVKTYTGSITETQRIPTSHNGIKLVIINIGEMLQEKLEQLPKVERES
ncbi:RNA-directed DNA polymerase, eukaryota [Tanacetum coccineum]|uniref:RNA-directed DNA polymerase, eukaryota n=1 Tax=Tanacetum coccineum TaxID=301880 RepID=A0ABQ5ELT2_9ASTR